MSQTRCSRLFYWGSAVSSEILCTARKWGGARRRRSLSFVWGALVFILLAGGCAQPRGVVFEPPEQPLYWPQPPEPARIHYVGQLVTSLDLKPAVPFGQALGQALFGKDVSHSMLTPYALCTDLEDRLFVCDSNAQAVHVFNLDSRKYEQWKPTVEGVAFSQPVGIVFDSLGRLLVADSMASTIFVFDGHGNFLGDIGDEHLYRPCGLAVDRATNRIFVADSGAHQVVVLAIDGELIERIGERGIEPGRFNYPTNVAVDGAGRLYVSDSLNFRVQVFDRDLQFLRTIGGKGDLPGYFSLPKGLALDSEDHLYVIDSHFESVQIFDHEGRVLLTFGEEGHGPGQFWLPAGICIDLDDRIWIADSYNRRVQVFDYRPELEP